MSQYLCAMGTDMSNSIRVLQPFLKAGMWVFNDEAVGLREEPFVSGIDDMIFKVFEQKHGRETREGDKVTLVFSADPFPGCQIHLEWMRGDVGNSEREGNWYRAGELDMDGWLCPALFKYFERAPQNLYIEFREAK
jgi:hypothetical protein